MYSLVLFAMYILGLWEMLPPLGADMPLCPAENLGKGTSENEHYKYVWLYDKQEFHK